MQTATFHMARNASRYSNRNTWEEIYDVTEVFMRVNSTDELDPGY